MAILRIKAGGSNTAPYDTWAGALPTLEAAVAVMAAGDTLWISSAHTQSGASLNITVPGTVGNPSRILCVTESGAGGASGVATGAVIEVTGGTFQVAGNFYAEGITWRSTATTATIVSFAFSSGNVQRFNKCRFEQTGANTNSAIKFGTFTSGVSTAAVCKDCTFRFSFAGQRINVDYNLRIVGGGLDPAGTAVSGLFNLSSSGRGCTLRVDGFDMAQATAAFTPVAIIGAGAAWARLRSLKLPASWTGTPVASGQIKAGDRIEMIDASSGATPFGLWVTDHVGSIRDDSVVKVTAQARGFRMASAAECSLAAPLLSHEVEFPATGSAQTVTWDVCTDGVTLTDADAWVEIDYFATNGSLLSSTVNDGPLNLVAAASNQATSTTPWTTTGFASPVRQALSATFTAGSASKAIARLMVARPSTTLVAAEQPAVA